MFLLYILEVPLISIFFGELFFELELEEIWIGLKVFVKLLLELFSLSLLKTLFGLILFLLAGLILILFFLLSSLGSVLI